MAQAISIKIQKGKTPVFPKRCVYSGEENPDGEGVLVAHGANPILTLFVPLLHLFGWNKIRFPLCRKYRFKFYLHYYFRELIIWSIVAVSVFYFMPKFDRHDVFRKWKVIGLCFSTLIPWVIFEVMFARKFDITADDKGIEYEFTDVSYALEFSILNSNIQVTG